MKKTLTLVLLLMLGVYTLNAQSKKNNKVHTTPKVEKKVEDINYDKLSIENLEKKAAINDALAIFELGNRYNDGTGGVDLDISKAIFWFKKAANTDYRCAKELANIFYEKDGFVDYVQAMYWYKKFIDFFKNDKEFNLTDIYYKIGEMYYNGQGVSKDYNEAINWYTKAVEGEFPEVGAFHQLGMIYYYGQGVSIDYSKALEYLLQCDCSDANYILGWMYYHGQGTSTDYEKALNYYKLAAHAAINGERGDKKAMEQLVIMYKNGLGTKVDMDMSNYWSKMIEYRFKSE